MVFSFIPPLLSFPKFFSLIPILYQLISIILFIIIILLFILYYLFIIIIIIINNIDFIKEKTLEIEVFILFYLPDIVSIQYIIFNNLNLLVIY